MLRPNSVLHWQTIVQGTTVKCRCDSAHSKALSAKADFKWLPASLYIKTYLYIYFFLFWVLMSVVTYTWPIWPLTFNLNLYNLRVTGSKAADCGTSIIACVWGLYASKQHWTIRHLLYVRIVLYNNATPVLRPNDLCYWWIRVYRTVESFLKT